MLNVIGFTERRSRMQLNDVFFFFLQKTFRASWFCISRANKGRPTPVVGRPQRARINFSRRLKAALSATSSACTKGDLRRLLVCNGVAGPRLARFCAPLALLMNLIALAACVHLAPINTRRPLAHRFLIFLIRCQDDSHRRPLRAPDRPGCDLKGLF